MPVKSFYEKIRRCTVILENYRKTSSSLGYLPFTWENRKFQLENQMVRAIPLGKLQKIWAVI